MKKWIQKCIDIFSYRLRLMQKLLLTYVILIILPLLIFTIWTYRDVERTLLEQFGYSSELAVSQTGVYLDKIMGDLTADTREMVAYEALLDALRNAAGGQELMWVIRDYWKVCGDMEGLLPMEILYSVQVYADDSIYYARKIDEGSTGIGFLSCKLPEALRLEEMLQNNQAEVLWRYPHTIQNTIQKKETDVVSGARRIRDSRNYQSLGILVVNIPRVYLDDLTSRVAILPGSLGLLLDENGRVIAMSDEKLLEQYESDLDQIAKTLKTGNEALELSGESFSIRSYPLKSTKWKLVSLLPYREILRTSVEARNKMVLMMLLLSLLFLSMAYYIAELVTRRIRVLNERLLEVRLDHFTGLSLRESKDEVGELVKSYNYMMDKINAYARSQYQLGMELQRSELELLQAQINPHFLYNTLDMIRWISDSYGAEEISEIVALLSRFYRLSLSNGQEVVSVEDSLLHIDAYVRLQNYRFDDSIQLEIAVEPQIYQYRILKLFLQPIVENAIVHGIQEKEDQKGRILIRGTLEEEILKFQIIDDGIGMTEEGSFMSDIPVSLGESAKIDGANDLQIFWKITLPLSKPVLATVGLFAALAHWGDWYNAMLFCTDAKQYPLQYYLYMIINRAKALSQLSSSGGLVGMVELPTETYKLAVTVVTTGPIILVYPFVQKYFIKGMTVGAVKG